MLSNTLLNKLKQIDHSRQDLDVLLKNKGLNAVDKSLPGLIGEVGKLSLYDKVVPEAWDGIVEPESPPEDYYRGDDDWRSVIDVEDIIANDTYNYNGKTLIIYRVSDLYKLGSDTNAWSKDFLVAGFGGAAYRFSDIPDTTSTAQYHVWDKTKDLVADNGEHFRWVIIYSNANARIGSEVIADAFICWQGTFNEISLQYTETSMYYYSYNGNPNSSNNMNQKLGPRESPKYVEIREAVSVAAIGMAYNVSVNDSRYKHRLKTFICDGTIRSHLWLSQGRDLEYVRVANMEGIVGTTSYRGLCDLGGYIQVETPGFYSGEYNTKRTYIDIHVSETLAESDVPDVTIRCISNTYLHINRCYNFGGENVNAAATFSNYMHSDKAKVIIDTCEGELRYLGGSDDPLSTNTIEVKKARNIASYCFRIDNSNMHPNYTRIKIPLICGSISTLGFAGCKRLFDTITFERWDELDTTNRSLSDGAFYDSSVKIIDMSNSNVTGLGNGSSYDPFDTSGSSKTYGKTPLKYIKLSPKCTSIPAYCFYKCVELENIDIPDSVISIGERAFAGCVSLKAITLSENVTSMGAYAFENCYSLETMIYPSTKVTSIPAYMCASCYNLKVVELPQMINTISDHAFQHCRSLETITLPENIITIWDAAFEFCYNLREVRNISNITKIGNYAFSNCHELTYEGLPLDLSKITQRDTSKAEYRQHVFSFSPKLTVYIPSAWSGMQLAGCALVPSNLADSVTSYSLCAYADWSIDNMLRLLESLPDRTGKSKLTLSCGTDLLTNVTFKNTYIGKNKYIHVNEDGSLVYKPQQDDTDITIDAYLTSKNITLN